MQPALSEVEEMAKYMQYEQVTGGQVWVRQLMNFVVDAHFYMRQ